MSRTTNWDNELDSIDLQDLLAPKARQILEGQGEQDARHSVFHLAREALGWQNWTREHDIPLTGNPMVLTQQAARQLGVSVSDANAAFAQAQSQDCVPAAKYKRGDEACWMKIATLDPQIYRACCPAEEQPQIDQLISQHQSEQNSPHQSRFQPNPHSEQEHQSEQTTTQTATATKEPPNSIPGIQIEVEPAPSNFLSPQQQRDQEMAQLGRAIVGIAGTENGNRLTFEGKANYTIVVNLNTNTMRITAKDRGEQPILIDASGTIDHKNSRVTAQDVEKFKHALQFLNQKQPRNEAGQER